MSWPRAFFFSVCVLSVAIIVGALSPVVAQQRGGGFMVASDGRAFVWRVNTVTGAVSYCVRRDDSLDQQFIATRPPYCSAQTPAVQ